LEKCPDCGSNAIISDQEKGERTCTRCGLVISQRVLYDPFDFGNPSARARPKVPQPRLLQTRTDFKGAFRKDWMLRAPEETALARGMAEVYRISALLNLPAVVRDFILLKLKSLPKKQGKNPRSSRISALIKLACKIHDHYVPLAEIISAVNECTTASTTKKLVLREYGELKMFLCKPIPEKLAIQRGTIVDLVISSARSLGTSEMVENALKAHMQLSKSLRFRSKKPQLQVALVWRYLVSQGNVELKIKGIAEALAVPEQSIRPSNDSVQPLRLFVSPKT